MSTREPRLGPAALERLAQLAREAAAPGEALARYQLGRELGRGAMGVVVEARDLALDRPVALKLLTRTAELSPDARTRFLREARAAARLSHPFIAAVYDANEAFIAMQLVHGHDLATRPVRDPRLVATLVRDAALAVHYAHSQGLVHRDLKPANLMATADVPPRVVVMDFGLAKETALDAGSMREDPAPAESQPDATGLGAATTRVGGGTLGGAATLDSRCAEGAAMRSSGSPSREDPRRVRLSSQAAGDRLSCSELSRSGSIVGTPAYMAPEQALGARGTVDARTDVYGLGATLYDQLAGRPPFTGGSVLEILRAAAEDEPVPLRVLAPEVDRDLATIVETCLAKAPERRYASALALAGDLDRWLSGEMILARPPSLAYRVRRFLAKRQGTLVAALAAGVLPLLFVAPFWLHARERRALAEQALPLAESVERALERARALRTSARPSEAAAVLEQATRAVREFSARADVGRASLFLGRLLAAQGRMEDAMAAFDRALVLDPSLAEARLERGLVRGVLVREGTRIGEAPSAEIERERAAAIADLSGRPAATGLVPSRDAAWGEACLAWLRGEHELAKRLCQDVLLLDPTHVEAYLVLARIASEAGEHERAMFLASAAVDVMGGLVQPYLGRPQGSSAAIEVGWARLPDRHELILDLRKAAAAKPTQAYTNAALAQEGLEAGARALAAGDAAAALRELDVAERNLAHALRAADADPVILAARGVCALLRDEALTSLARTAESVEARETAARDFAAASLLDAGEVRAAVCWNQSLLAERTSLLALLAGDAAAAAVARDEAAAARARALAAAQPQGALAALLGTECAQR